MNAQRKDRPVKDGLSLMPAKGSLAIPRHESLAKTAQNFTRSLPDTEPTGSDPPTDTVDTFHQLDTSDCDVNTCELY